jgi:ribose/xylose/arabinose/galactoside ABC-type transport system permease subunit
VNHRDAPTQRHQGSTDEPGPSAIEVSAMGFVWFIAVGFMATFGAILLVMDLQLIKHYWGTSVTL